MDMSKKSKFETCNCGLQMAYEDMRDKALEAQELYEAETKSTAELMAENNKLSYALHQIAGADIIKWDAESQEEFEGLFLPWAQKIARDALASESQREAAETADEKPDGQAENS
jgi:hypothetical protein